MSENGSFVQRREFLLAAAAGLPGLANAATPASADVHGSQRFLSVRDFGAKGDNSTDDTEAIRAALAALYARRGGVLVFPAGRYLFTSFKIDRDYNVLLLGEGNSDMPEQAATVLRCIERAGDGHIAIDVAGGTGLIPTLQAFRDMNITGGTEREVPYRKTVNNGIGVRAHIAHRFEMRNVSIFGFAKYGLEYSGGTFYGVFDHCLFRYNGKYGMWCDQSNTTTLIGCHFHLNNGIGLRNPPGPLVGCVFQGNASHGCALESPPGVLASFIGCYFEGNNLVDAAPGGDIFAGTSANVNVQDCWFATTYDDRKSSTSNLRGTFNQLKLSGVNRFFKPRVQFNVFSDQRPCRIVDETPAPLAYGAATRFIDTSSSVVTYVARNGPNGDREEIDVVGESIAVGPSTSLLELTGSSPQKVATILGPTGADGRLLQVRLKGRQIELRHAAGNLSLSGDFAGSKSGYSMISLMYFSYMSRWIEVSRSPN